MMPNMTEEAEAEVAAILLQMYTLVKINLFLKDAASVRLSHWLITFCYVATDLIKKESVKRGLRETNILYKYGTR